MKYYSCIAMALVILLQSCADDPNKKIPVKTAFKAGPMDSAYSALRPALQHFTIDNKKSTIVKAANGTEILVPANCFVDGNGNIVSGNITVEIVEAFSLQDFIVSGLATLSDDKMLLSNGMMYINASSGDTRLQLAKGASLSVSMPTMSSPAGFQMFTGDGSNWQVDSSMSAIDYTFTLPLNLLYPHGNKFFYYCIVGVGDRNERTYYYDTTIINVLNKKYEHTVIATHEFQKRYYSLASMMYRMSYFVNRDYYFDITDCEDQKFNYDILRVYFDRPDRSFKESDSIAKKMYIDYFNANEKKIEDFYEKVNEHKRTYYNNWTDTNYYFDSRKVSIKDSYMEVLKYFPPKNSTEIMRINDRGVDLNAANAYDLLKAKGLDAKEINKILTYNFQRQSRIKILQQEKDADADKEKLNKMYRSTLFSVTTMGWINCDRFFDDPEAGKAEMYVTNASGTNLNFIDCSLVIPDMNVRLSAFQSKAGTYAFTKKDGPYTKLPIGKSAVIVGVAIQHDSLFFASKKVTIKDGLNIGLQMKHVYAKNLKDSLKAALN
jgi:hypothetical protein